VRRFPDNKIFAFSVFDDTDFSTVQNVRPVYDFLAELGVYTTKSVWPLPSLPHRVNGGASLKDMDYLQFVMWLQKEGFEIGAHGARNHDATRKVTERGLEEFCNLIGQYPRTYTGHLSNRENMYWGAARMNSFLIRCGYNLATRFTHGRRFTGHVKTSQYFWGDICAKHISYVRNFVFGEINLDRINPTMPYHDPKKPYVNFWFSSCEGGDVNSFCEMLCEENQDRLEAEGGVCIMYTHFAKGFFEGGLHAKFEYLMRRLAKMNGWFVPVARLLDHLQRGKENFDIPREELANMERRWFLSKLLKGTS